MQIIFKDGYEMRSAYQEPGHVRVTDSNGVITTKTNEEWKAMVALALANGANRV